MGKQTCVRDIKQNKTKRNESNQIKSTNQPINRPINRPTNQPTKQTNKQTTQQITNITLKQTKPESNQINM
jgi:hypothetical protein